MTVKSQNSAEVAGMKRKCPSTLDPRSHLEGGSPGHTSMPNCWAQRAPGAHGSALGFHVCTMFFSNRSPQ